MPTLRAVFAIVSLLAATTVPSVSVAQTAAERSLRGRVVGPDAEAIAGVDVRVVSAGRTLRAVVTDSAGGYVVGPLRLSVDAALHFRRLGFRPGVVLVSSAPAGDIDVTLDGIPEELAGVVITATGGALAEFYSHRAAASFGSFFTPEEIRRESPRMLSDLMRRVPGARLLPGRFGSLVRIRGCRPTLWIDGVRIQQAELDETINVDDVAAVEVYNSFAGIPAQYVDRTTNCGAIVVWIKR